MMGASSSRMYGAYIALSVIRVLHTLDVTRKCNEPYWLCFPFKWKYSIRYTAASCSSLTSPLLLFCSVLFIFIRLHTFLCVYSIGNYVCSCASRASPPLRLHEILGNFFPHKYSLSLSLSYALYMALPRVSFHKTHSVFFVVVVVAVVVVVDKCSPNSIPYWVHCGHAISDWRTDERKKKMKKNLTSSLLAALFNQNNRIKCNGKILSVELAEKQSMRNVNVSNVSGRTTK